MTLAPLHYASAWVGEADEGALEPEERALLTARMTPKRRADFVAGRLAARRALDALESATDGSGADRRWVDRDPLGAIFVHGDRPLALPRFVSITHADGLAIAGAAEVRVGIDVVTLEAPTSGLRDETGDAEEHEAFAAWLVVRMEDAVGPSLAPLLLFAAKEAASKWLGVGLHAGLRELVLAPIERDTLELRAHDASARLHASLDVDGRRAIVALRGDDPAGVGERARARARAALHPEIPFRGVER